MDDDGRFIPEVAHFAGLTVWDANPQIIALLRGAGALVAEVPLSHTYPHCWRCKNPTLFRATEQWFIALDQGRALRERALDAIRNEVEWIPPWGEERIYNMIAHRPDWAISRQRVWGVPIVAFYCAACERAAPRRARSSSTWPPSCATGAGADEWYARAGRGAAARRARAARSAAGASFRKETDILDVWFDSGCSHAAVLETRPELRWPAEMYLEGSDQHRGWFHSSLLEAVGTRGRAAVPRRPHPRLRGRRRGRKMSKSIGNYRRAGASVIPKYGAEVLRLWVAAEDYTAGHPALRRDPGPARRRVPADPQHLPLPPREPRRLRPERRPRSRTPRSTSSTAGPCCGSAGLIARVRRAYEEYEFHVVFHAVHNFCAVDLSALYLDILKDRLYTSAADDPERRAAQTACYEVLDALARLMAPILTFTAEEVWDHIPGGRQAARACTSTDFPERARRVARRARSSAEWERLLEVRGEVAKALEAARSREADRQGARRPRDALRRAHPRLQRRSLRAGKGDGSSGRCSSSRRVEIVGRAAGGLATGPDRVVLREPGHPGPRRRGARTGAGLARSASAAGRGAPRVGEDPEHPALCERCLPIIRAGTA